MTLEIYSTALTIGLGGIALATLVTIFGYFLLPAFRQRLLQINYFTYIKTIGVLAITATLGALFYQFYYATPVCELCWWQRIFMFPIDIVVLVSLMYLVRVNHIIVGILASFGAAFALYHYYYHFQIFVLGKTLSLPCNAYGLLPACTSSPIVIFGFVTIPLMALVVFVSILALVFLAHKVSNNQGN
jgi:disulfide bond formation protein DsbB